MITLHLGWPKTGTTSLQEALVRNQGRLEAAGVIYPSRWRRAIDGSHNDLQSPLRRGRQGRDAVLDFLSGTTGEEVLFSAEVLTYWLFTPDRAEALRLFLAALAREHSVQVLWTLRRLDDLAISLYVKMTASGRPVPPAEEFMRQLELGTLFSGMREVEDDLDGRVHYVDYQPAGAHNAELLEMARVPADLAAEICAAVAGGKRLNSARTHKQLVALGNLDVLSSKLGVRVDRADLERLFDQGFSFACDRRPVLVSDEVRADVQERMLEAAKREGLDAYVSRFGGHHVTPSAGPVTWLDADSLDGRDLEALAASLKAEGAP